MGDPTWLFIQLCWVAWLIYWVIMAFSSKATIERGGFFGYRLVAAIPILVWIVAAQLLHVSWQARLWQTTPALGVATDLLMLAGAAFTVWARITLGRNWSLEVTFKRDHELVESGPYALARHPIYTGLITMALATAINYGRALGFVLLFALCASLWWKARAEEVMIAKHFPEAYGEYRSRVRAIIPFVL